MSRSYCRSCNARIAWQESRRGKRMPLDPDWLSVARADPKHPEAERVVLASSGEVISAVRLDPRDESGLRARVPHWATCPAADQHRGRSREPNLGPEPWQDAIRRLGAELEELKRARAELLGVIAGLVADYDACLEASTPPAKAAAWRALGARVDAVRGLS